MGVYQLLDAIIEIRGDVRYFLCGLDSDQSQKVDTSTEEQCWALTEKLMTALDEHYSALIEIEDVEEVGDGEGDGDADDEFMDDYDEEDIPEREKLFAQSVPVPNESETQMAEDVFAAMAHINTEAGTETGATTTPVMEETAQISTPQSVSSEHLAAMAHTSHVSEVSHGSQDTRVTHLTRHNT